MLPHPIEHVISALRTMLRKLAEHTCDDDLAAGLNPRRDLKTREIVRISLWSCHFEVTSTYQHIP